MHVSWTAISQIGINRLSDVSKRQVTRGALAPWDPKFELSMRPIGPLFWWCCRHLCVLVIDLTPLGTGRTGCGIWTSKCECTIAPALSFWLGTMWKLLHCHLNSVTSSTSFAQRVGFHTSAAEYCSSRCLLVSRTIIQSYWMIKSVPPVLGSLQFGGITF